MTNLDSILKKFVNKSTYSQGYGFSIGHVSMWELDQKESWMPKNWCFWTVMLEKTLESPLDGKEIKQFNSKWNQSWIFIERTGAEAESAILMVTWCDNWFTGEDPDAGKDWRQEEKEKGMTEDEVVVWHHWLDRHEFEQALGVGDGQGSLVFCSQKESDMTERLSWNEQQLQLKWIKCLIRFWVSDYFLFSLVQQFCPVLWQNY